MKVLLANKFFFMKGGAERVFFLEREFLLRKEISVIDFSMADVRNLPSPYSNYFVSNVDYQSSDTIRCKIQQAASFIHSSEAVRKLAMLVAREKPNIAHLHNIYHQLTPSIIHVLKREGAKVVLTVHDGKLICPNYLMLSKGRPCPACDGRSFWKVLALNCTGSRPREFLLVLEAYFHKWARSYEKVDLFLSPSRFFADLIGNRVPPGRIRVLPNAIDTTLYTPSLRDDGYPLYVGRLSQEKGLRTLLEASESLQQGSQLTIVGTGPLEAQLKKQARTTEFLGHQEGTRLRQIIANSGFVVVPSEWYENSPMVVLEAMAMGKPVIASRIGGIPEQVDDGRTGLLFEMGDVTDLQQKMRQLLERPGLRKTMGTAARLKVETEYSLEAHCNQLLTIYHELLTTSVRTNSGRSRLY